MQLMTCVVIISSIWLFSVLVTLPYGLYMNHKYVDGRFYCEETWPSENFRQVSCRNYTSKHNAWQWQGRGFVGMPDT